jgi:ATP-dependent Lhr-like helicase
LYFREDLAELGPPQLRGATAGTTDQPQHAAVRERLAAGACFFTDLLVDVELAPEELQEALWDLVWAGEATNDAFSPLRAPRLTPKPASRASPSHAASPPSSCPARWQVVADGAFVCRGG